MGFFSWKTCDTKRSICNAHSGRQTFDVYMIDNKGNVWHEPDYNGYGIFGGKDYYELLAEMNGFGTDRSVGIDLQFHPEDMNMKKSEILFPNLVETADWEYDPKMAPQTCPDQGYFYEGIEI